jgi:hypothetical protein
MTSCGGDAKAHRAEVIAKLANSLYETMEHLTSLQTSQWSVRMSCVRMIKSFTRFAARLFSNIEPIFLVCLQSRTASEDNVI